MNAASTIIQALLDAPDDFTVKGELGTGPHARRVREDSDIYKIIVPGNAMGTAKYMVFLLLFDLSVDLGLSDELRGTLIKQFEREG